jgi:hypothetical protein
MIMAIDDDNDDCSNLINDLIIYALTQRSKYKC